MLYTGYINNYNAALKELTTAKKDCAAFAEVLRVRTNHLSWFFLPSFLSYVPLPNPFKEMRNEARVRFSGFAFFPYHASTTDAQIFNVVGGNLICVYGWPYPVTPHFQQDLVRKTPKGTCGHEFLVSAVDRVKGTTNFINEQKRQNENLERRLKIQTQLVGKYVKDLVRLFLTPCPHCPF